MRLCYYQAESVIREFLISILVMVLLGRASMLDSLPCLPAVAVSYC